MESAPNPPLRRNGRVVAFTLLALIGTTVVSALVFWFRGREPSGAIQRLAVLDEHAAVVVRKGYRQRDYVHLTVRDLKAGQRWKMALWALLEDSRPLVRGDHVMMRVRDQLGRPETHAFRLSSGAFAWRAARVMRGPNDPVRGASVLGPHRLFEASGGHDGEVFAINPETGRVFFDVKRPGGDGPVHATPDGDGVVADLGDGNLVRIDARGVSAEVGRGSACALGDDVALLLADGTVHIGDATLPPMPALAGRPMVACTRTHSRDVLIVGGEGTRVLTRPTTGGELATILEEPARLATTIDVPTGTSGSTLPLVFPGGRLVVLDVGTGRVTRYELTRPGPSGRDVATAVLGDSANVIVRGAVAVAFLAAGEERVVLLEGGPTTQPELAVRGDVAFLSRGEGLVGVDLRKRALLGSHGPLHATFEEGGLTRVTRSAPSAP